MACKILPLEEDVLEGVGITSIREINLLLHAQHPNIVNLREVACKSHQPARHLCFLVLGLCVCLLASRI